MAKLNETYEAMVVFSLKQGEDGIKALTEKFKGMMAEAGSVESVDEWGKKKLAYDIQHMSEGFYYFIQFDANTDVPAAVEQDVRIMDNVLRFLCVKKDEA